MKIKNNAKFRIGDSITNLCDIYLDIQEFKKLTAEIESDKTENDEIKSLFTNIDDPKDPCSKSNMIMNNNISNIISVEMPEDDEDF